MKTSILSLNIKNITDFAKERNRLLSKSKTKWVLFVDTDEKINNYQTPISSKFSGYKIRRDNYFLGDFVGSEWIVRLGKKNSGKWERAIHEKWQINGLVSKLGGTTITHNTAENLSTYINKINKYSTIHALENKREGKTTNIFKILFYPPIKFIVTFYKSKNVVFSIMQSFHSFLAWSKQYE